MPRLNSIPKLKEMALKEVSDNVFRYAFVFKDPQAAVLEQSYLVLKKNGTTYKRRKMNRNALCFENVTTGNDIPDCEQDGYIHDDRTDTPEPCSNIPKNENTDDGEGYPNQQESGTRLQTNDKTATDREQNHAIRGLSDALKKYKNIDIKPHLYTKLNTAVLEIMLTWLKEVVESDLPVGDSCKRVEGADSPAVIIDSDIEPKTNNDGKSNDKKSLFGSGEASNKEIEVFKEVKKRKSKPPSFNFRPVNTNCRNTQVCRPTPPGIAADKALTVNQNQLANSVPIGTRQLRPIVIDGSNIAREHGKRKNVFSCRGIAVAIDYFLERGHRNVTAFVPQYRRGNCFDVQTTDQGVLEKLADKQLVFTPSRKLGKKRICSCDDRFIVDLVFRTGGVIVSNDNFRDLMGENEKWKRTIEERLLMFCFVDDIFMIPKVPLGRCGPRLDDFLAFTDT